MAGYKTGEFGWATHDARSLRGAGSSRSRYPITDISGRAMRVMPVWRQLQRSVRPGGICCAYVRKSQRGGRGGSERKHEHACMYVCLCLCLCARAVCVRLRVRVRVYVCTLWCCLCGLHVR